MLHFEKDHVSSQFLPITSGTYSTMSSNRSTDKEKEARIEISLQPSLTFLPLRSLVEEPC